MTALSVTKGCKPLPIPRQPVCLCRSHPPPQPVSSLHLFRDRCKNRLQRRQPAPERPPASIDRFQSAAGALKRNEPFAQFITPLGDRSPPVPSVLLLPSPGFR